VYKRQVKAIIHLVVKCGLRIVGESQLPIIA
jgi:hypothetical protein